MAVSAEAAAVLYLQVREGTWRQQHVAVKILLRAADDPEVAAAVRSLARPGACKT